MLLPRAAWAILACCVSAVSLSRAQPVVHLTFDSATDLAKDASGRSHNGSANGTVIATSNGVAGGAAQFDGAGFIGLDHNVASALSANFTISLWVATTTSTGNNGDSALNGAGIVAALDHTASSTTAALGLNGGVIGFAAASDETTLHSQAAVNTGNFVHVVVTQDASTGARSVFVNGALDNQSQGSSIADAVHDILTLGANPGQSSYFAGVIDDFQVYDQALNASDVAFLHANPGSAVGLLAVPEPSVLALLALGVGRIAARRSRWRPRKT
ncbi:MAG: LamG domain-containing protein [Opitutae bacterium]|nr:LamG domain-containing protein [Opitutae bacterium]